jgi:DNA-binding CsgD family transcriptional regulator
MSMQLVAQEPFAAVLQRYRLAAGLSQGELAERAGLSERGISDLERGVRRQPHPSTMRQLADGLGLDTSDRAELLEARSGRPRRVPSGGPYPGEALPASRAASLLLDCLDAYLSVTHDRRRMAERVISLAALHLALDDERAGLDEPTDLLAWSRQRQRRRGLTSREHEVARLVARGFSNRELADELVITEKTAKNHVQRVLDKLGARSRAEVAARAEEFGLRVS